MAPKLAHLPKPAKRAIGKDLPGAYDGQFIRGVSAAGPSRLPVRLIASLPYLKSSFNLSDEELVDRWAENERPFFSGMACYEPRLLFLSLLSADRVCARHMSRAAGKANDIRVGKQAIAQLHAINQGIAACGA